MSTKNQLSFTTFISSQMSLQDAEPYPETTMPIPVGCMPSQVKEALASAQLLTR